MSDTNKEFVPKEKLIEVAEIYASLPKVLINFALNNSSSVASLLDSLIKMSKWDTKELEEFYSKYPGLRPKSE